MIFPPRLRLRFSHLSAISPAKRQETAVSLGMIFLLAAPLFARADPVSTFGRGGTLAPVWGGKNVRMLWQDVRVSLPSRRVVVRAALKNEGGATVVCVGLPEEGEVRPGPFPFGGYLNNHRTFVDNLPLRPAQREFNGPEPGRWETWYRFYWTHTLRFAPGQTRVVEERFQAGQGFELDGSPEGGSFQRFSFGLSEGRGWKGAIGRLRVEFDTSELKNATALKFRLPGAKNLGANRFEWRDFEPSADPEDAVSFLEASWWPGVRDISLNGKAVFPRAQVVGQDLDSGEYLAVYPRKIGNSIWAPMRLVAQWLPPAPRDRFSEGDIAQGAYRAFRGLYWNGLNIGTEIGTPYLDISGQGYNGRAKMSAPSFDQNGTTMIELAPLILALGSKISFDAKTGAVRIELQPEK